MKKPYRYLLHIFYWFLFYGWRELASTLFTPGHVFNIATLFTPLSVGGFIVFMVPFYINYLWLMQRYFRRNEMRQCWLGWVSLLVFFIIFRYFIEEFLFGRLFGSHNYSPGTGFVFYAFDNVYFGINTILMSIFMWAIVNWKGLEKERNELARERNAAELNLLKSQVNPHFLFNTLNNIYSLVYQKSNNALPAIMQLSGLMRFMTTEARTDKIELAKEIEYIKNCIALESLRTTEKAIVELTVEGASRDVQIAPLILIPFIENGFKHGVITDPQNPFTILINVQQNELTMSVNNKVNPRSTNNGSGTGLANVRRRLEILYAGRHTLESGRQGENYICNLRIQL